MTGAATSSLFGFWASTTLMTLAVLPLVALLALGPGLLPSIAIGRRLSTSLPESLAIAFALSYAIVGVATYLAYFLGLSLTAAVAGWLVLSFIVALVAWRYRGEGRMPGRRYAWLITLVPGLLSLLQGVWMGLTGDVFFHLGAPRSLLQRNAPLVTDPLYGTGTTVLDPVSGIWHTSLAMWSRVTGLDVVLLWQALAVICAALLGASFFWLCRTVSRSDKAAFWATAAFIFALQADFRGIVYPNQGSRIFIFVAIAAVILLAQRASVAAWLAAVAAGLSAGLVHLATAQFYYVFIAAAVVAVAIGNRRAGAVGAPVDWRAWRWLLGVAVATIGLTAPSVLIRAKVAGSSVMLERTAYDIEMWHHLLPLDILVPRMSWEFLPRPSPIAEVGALGVTAVALVLLAAMVMRAWHDPQPRLWGGLAAGSLAFWIMQFPPITMLGVPLLPYMLYRLASLTAFTRFVLAASAMSDERLLASRWRLLGPVALAIFVLITVPSAVATWTGFGEEWGRNKPSFVSSLSVDVRYAWGADAIEDVRDLASDDFPRIAGDTATGYYLVGLAPVSTVAVGATHSTWSIERTEGDDRRAAMRLLLDPATTAEERADLLERYDVDYVAVSHETSGYPEVRASLREQDELFEPVVVSDNLEVFSVR